MGEDNIAHVIISSWIGNVQASFHPRVFFVFFSLTPDKPPANDLGHTLEIIISPKNQWRVARGGFDKCDKQDNLANSSTVSCFNHTSSRRPGCEFKAEFSFFKIFEKTLNVRKILSKHIL